MNNQEQNDKIFEVTTFIGMIITAIVIFTDIIF